MKTLEDYRKLPYKRTLSRFRDEEDGELYFLVSFKEIPSVKGISKDRLEAVKLANELFDSYVEAHLEWGDPIPEPAAKRFRRGGAQNVDMPAGMETDSEAEFQESGKRDLQYA